MIVKNAKTSDGRVVDLWLQDGRIFAMGIGLPTHGQEVLNAKGRTVLPAFIDLHCHWRTPGFEYKEDIATGSAAAAAGGYTFVNLMANTKPVCSDSIQAHAVMEQARHIGLCDVNQTVSITQDFDGENLDHLKSLPQDLRFISDDGKGVANNAVMAKAFAICHERGLTLMSHAEEMEISPWDYRLAENLETVRNLHLAEYYDARLHLCHVSTKEAVEAVEAAKWRGAPVTCEVTPHHLWFHDVDKMVDPDTGKPIPQPGSENNGLKVNPPIRAREDVEALVRGIVSGAVDAIATDHAPHTQEDKAAGAAGMLGLETAFGVCYTALCVQRGLPLELLSQLMSTNPAAILGLPTKGRLAVGMDADLVLVDLETPYTVDRDQLHSKSRNCPYHGQQLYGKVCTTIKGGKITWQASEEN